MNKSDSKYYNTALLMDEALLILLEKKEFEFITITEVCQKAGVNRSTFYLHYENMDDLLMETIEMINRRFNKAFNNKKVNASLASKEELFFIDDDNLIPYLNFVKENKKIYKLINAKPYIFKSQSKLNSFYVDIFDKVLEKYNVSKEEKDYVFSYYTFGTVAIIQKWLERDCVDEISFIVEIIKKLIGYNYEK